MRRFTGMTLPVANFLVENVFCILDDPTDDSQRIGAREFGVWVRDLPTLMAAPQPVTHTHSRGPSTTSIATGHPIASAPASRRPSSRQPSIASGSPRRPPVVLRSLTRNTSMGPVLDGDDSGATRPALDLVLDEEDEEEQQLQQPREQEQREAEVRSPSPSVRSNSNTKRRKRGRKGKGMNPSMDHIQTSELLASASETLARELSRQTRSASATLQSFPDVPPPPPIPEPVSMPTVTKKPSRWKLSYFGKSGGEATTSTRSDSQTSHPISNQASTRTTRVTNLLMGLDSSSAPTPPLPSPPSQVSPLVVGSLAQARGEPQSQSRRAASPTSTRSGRATSGSSASDNWRISMASTNTSTSTFTRYSNQSMRSVSTFATSVSASSGSSSTNWRNKSGSALASTSSLASSLNSNNGSQSSHINGMPRWPPANIKRMYFSADALRLPGIHLLTGSYF